MSFIPNNQLYQSPTSPPLSKKHNHILFLTLLSLTLSHSLLFTTPIGTTIPSVLPKHTLRLTTATTNNHHHHHHNPYLRWKPIRQMTTHNSYSYFQSTSHPEEENPIHNYQSYSSSCSNRRRHFLSKILTTPSFLLLIVSQKPQPTHALQQRNEALCQTGFFEHYNEYRCTSIGDISDEGRTKSLSDQEERVSDGLLNKLDVGGVDVSGVFGGDEDDDKITIQKKKKDMGERRDDMMKE